MAFKCSATPRQECHTQCIVHKSSIPAMVSGGMQAQRALLLSHISNSSTHAKTMLLLQHQSFMHFIFLNYKQVPSCVLDTLHVAAVNE